MEYIIFNIGAAFFIGYAIGYAIRTGMKIFIFIVGIFLIGLFFLQAQGIVTLHPKNLNSLIEHMLISFQNFILYYYNILSQYPGEGVGAIVGFIVGLRRR